MTALSAGVLWSSAAAWGNPLDRPAGATSGNPLERARAPYHGPVPLTLPMRMSGEELTVEMLEFDAATARVAGSLRLGGAAYPFGGAYESTTAFRGAFEAGGQEYAFTLEGGAVAGYTLRTGESVYRLRAEARSDADRGAGASGAGAVAADVITGRWIGTMREEVDEGFVRRAPFTMTVTRLAGGRVAADVVAELQTPGNDGRMLDIRGTARFEGRMDGTRASLHAADSTMTVVQTGQTASIGPQEMEVSIDGEAMEGRIGNEDDGWSTFELRREAGSATNAPATPALREDGAGKDGSRPAGMPGSVTFNRVSLTDAGMGGAVSHTLLVPDGWRHEGGVRWNPPQLYQDAVHVALRVEGPDGTGYGVYAGGQFLWSDIYEISAQMGLASAGQVPQPGQVMPEGKRFLAPPRSTEAFVLELLLPSNRPGVSDARVVEVRPMPEVMAVLQQTLDSMASTTAMADQMAKQMNPNAGMSNTASAEIVRVSYTENGRAYEEQLIIVGYATVARIGMANGGLQTTVNWGVEDVLWVRNPAGAESNRATAEAASMSLRADPRWQATIMQMRREISRETNEGIVRRGQIHRETMEECFRMHQETVKSQQEASDRLQHKVVSMIREVDDYEMPGGGRVQLPIHFKNAYSNGQGQIVMTNTPIQTGGGWTELKRAQ